MPQPSLGLYRLRQYDRHLYRVDNPDIRLFDENLNNEGRPATGFGNWRLEAGTVPGQFRLRQYDRVLYRVGNLDAKLFDENLNNEGRPDIGYSNWVLDDGTVAGAFRLRQYDRVLYRVDNFTTKLFDENLNNEGRPDIGFSNWQFDAADPGPPAVKAANVPTGLYRLRQHERHLYRVGSPDIRLFDENLNNEGRPAIGFGNWQLEAGTVPGTFRLRQYDRYLYRVGNLDAKLFDESLNNDGRPDIGFSNWQLDVGTLDGTLRLWQYDRVLYRVDNFTTKLFDEKLDNEGRPGVEFSNWQLDAPQAADARSSDLSSSGFDFVCAVTQSAIDNTLRPYVIGLNVPEFSGCYGPSGPLSTDTVKGWIGGTDPFTLAAGTLPANVTTSAWVNGFWWGFKATPFTVHNLPRPPKLAPVVQLDQGPSSVRHQVSFAHFQLIWFTPPATLNCFTQDAANPVIFSSRVDLKVGDGDFSALPADLQTSLAAQHPGALFSIKQLFLDLSNSSIIDASPMGDVPNPLNNAAYIVSQYWQQLPARAAVLGYSVGVQAGASGAPAPSITPTALGCVVSPHLGPDGQPSGNLDRNTLNYLVMTENRPLPAAAPFAWNWVAADDYFGGVMTVRRDIFVGYLRSLLDPITAPLCIHPLDPHDGTAMTFPTSTSPASWQASAPPALLQIRFDDNANYTPPPPDGATISAVWSFFYSMSGSVSYDTASTVTLSLHVVVRAAGAIYQSLIGDYNIIDSQYSAAYTLAIGPAGQLTAAMTSSPIVDKSQNPTDWSLTDFLPPLRTTVLTAVQKAIEDFGAGMENLLQGSTDWVFPGGQTFMTSGVTFSDSGDLMVHVTYAQPH
jgi:hypothetical protein